MVEDGSRDENNKRGVRAPFFQFAYPFSSVRSSRRIRGLIQRSQRGRIITTWNWLCPTPRSMSRAVLHVLRAELVSATPCACRVGVLAKRVKSTNN